MSNERSSDPCCTFDQLKLDSMDNRLQSGCSLVGLRSWDSWTCASHGMDGRDVRRHAVREQSVRTYALDAYGRGMMAWRPSPKSWAQGGRWLDPPPVLSQYRQLVGIWDSGAGGTRTACDNASGSELQGGRWWPTVKVGGPSCWTVGCRWSLLTVALGQRVDIARRRRARVRFDIDAGANNRD